MSTSPKRIQQRRQRDKARAEQVAKIAEKKEMLASATSVPEDFVSVFDVPGLMAIGAVNADAVNIGGAYGLFVSTASDGDLAIAKDDGLGMISKLSYGAASFALEFQYSDDVPTDQKNTFFMSKILSSLEITYNETKSTCEIGAGTFRAYSVSEASLGGTDEACQIQVETVQISLICTDSDGYPWSVKLNGNGLSVDAKSITMGAAHLTTDVAYQTFYADAGNNASAIGAGGRVQFTKPLLSTSNLSIDGTGVITFAKKGVYDVSWQIPTSTAAAKQIAIYLESGDVEGASTPSILPWSTATGGASIQGRTLVHVTSDGTTISICNTGATAWSVLTTCDGSPCVCSVTIRRLEMTQFAE